MGALQHLPLPTAGALCWGIFEHGLIWGPLPISVTCITGSVSSPLPPSSLVSVSFSAQWGHSLPPSRRAVMRIDGATGVRHCAQPGMWQGIGREQLLKLSPSLPSWDVPRIGTGGPACVPSVQHDRMQGRREAVILYDTMGAATIPGLQPSSPGLCLFPPLC